MKRIAVLPHAFARRVAALDKPVRMGLAGTLALSTIAAGSLVYAASASAAVPAFPDNIVVFPDRDFVSIEGYQDKVDSTATIIVRRNGEITGKAEGTIAAGDPAIEVNHPGGVCWGTGADAPNVTPDIKAGDVVELLIDGEPVGETTTGSGTLANNTQAPANEFSGPPLERNGGTLLIRGTVGADIVLAQGEQRIIAPDLVDTDVQRRDVRAVPGPLTPAPRGGYSSSLVFENGGLGNGPTRFLATYIFEDGANNTAEELATIAAAGGPRYMSWQVEDFDANRQGLTIAEFGELGGPGFGGCPAGPQQAGPATPKDVVATTLSSGNSIKVDWTPAVAVPGTPAIVGYRVSVTDTATSPGTPSTVNEQDVVGKLINGQASTGTTIQGLQSGRTYRVNVRSINIDGLESIPGTTVDPSGPDSTPPTVSSAAPAGDGPFPTTQQVTLQSSESGSQIWFVTSALGTPADVLDPSGDPVLGAQLYTGPIEVTDSTRITAVAFDRVNNVSATAFFRDIEINNPGVADAPTISGIVPAQGELTVSWTRPNAPNTAPVTEYVVRAFEGTSTTATTTKTVNDPGGATSTFSTTLTGLNAVEHRITVAARNVSGLGPEATGTGTPTLLVVANAGSDRTAARGSSVALSATGSTAGGTYAWTQVDANGVPVSSGVTLAAVTSQGATSFTMPLVSNQVLPTAGNVPIATVTNRNSEPLFFRLTVTVAGQSQTDTVAITPSGDTVTIATGRYRAGSELRLNGSVSNGAATVRIYRRTATDYVFVGTAALTALPGGGATWELRLRNGQVPTTNGPWFAFSTFGGGAGPFNT